MESSAATASHRDFASLIDSARSAPPAVTAGLTVLVVGLLMFVASGNFSGLGDTVGELSALEIAAVALSSVAATVALMRAGGRSQYVALILMAYIATILVIITTLELLAQVSINGTVTGSYFALGAIGLTLVYGILKLVNFAHGDLLTMGAYIALFFNVTIGVPFVVALLLAVLLSAVVGVFFEFTLWRPMRRRNAGILQLVLMTIGLAFVIRNTIQLIAGAGQKRLDVNITDTIDLIGGLTIGRTQLIVVVIAFVVLSAVAYMLRSTSLGRQMRALADNFDLAETTGIDTNRVVVYTWILAAGLAGLAGVLVVASIGSLNPNTGFALLLPLFAAVVLGGIGNALGALVGGLVIGLAQEWSTLLIAPQWKTAIGFGVLIVVLIFRPQGIFGSDRTL
ncbi:MAG: branched-chain amino acid ABC transporter permease [Solirubrobacterales bacterium]